MLNLITRILGIRGYQPLNKILIFKKVLLDNYQCLLGVNTQVKIAPVVKSNAYGHGILQVSQILDSGCSKNGLEQPPFMCVDSLFEAYQLLKAKIKIPILIMGYIGPQALKVKKLPFSYAVYDLNLLESINNHQQGAKVHLFIDTGMGREGVTLKELPSFLQKLNQFKNIEIEGIMTHLAQADKPESKITKKQLDNFQQAVNICRRAGVIARYYHIGGSAVLFSKLPEVVNVVRCGWAIYGVTRLINQQTARLKPSLRLITKIVQIKQIEKGDIVGYNSTFTAFKKTTIGILPIGYNDGVDRRLSNKFEVLVDGVECPVIGLISMNLTTIDLNNVHNPAVGQEVVIFSDQTKDPNTILEAAQICDTIPSQLLVHLTPTMRREIVV